MGPEGFMPLKTFTGTIRFDPVPPEREETLTMLDAAIERVKAPPGAEEPGEDEGADEPAVYVTRSTETTFMPRKEELTALVPGSLVGEALPIVMEALTDKK